MCTFSAEVGPGFEQELLALEPLRADGLVEVKGTRVDVTELGQYFVRNVAMAFDAHLPQASARTFSRAV